MNPNVEKAIDNWLTAQFFLRQAEDLFYKRMRRMEPLSVNESNAAYDALDSFKKHIDVALEQMGDSRSER